MPVEECQREPPVLPGFAAADTTPSIGSLHGGDGPGHGLWYRSSPYSFILLKYHLDANAI